MRKHLVLLLMAMALCTLAAGPGRAAPESELRFKKWLLQKITNNDGAYLRLLSESDSSDVPGAIALFKYAGECGKTSFICFIDTKHKGLKDSDWMQGVLRVDEKSKHSFSYRYGPIKVNGAAKDNGVALLVLKDLENESELFDELRQGATLRVKCTIGQNAYITRFSTAGFAEALGKQNELCQALPTAGKKTAKDSQASSDKKQKEGGIGTGFFVNAQGYVVTNFHVVDGGKKISCEYQSTKYDAKVIKVDPINDLALLKVELTPKTVLAFRGGKSVRTGEEVVVLGFPYYGMVSTHPNITTGMISSPVGLGDDSRWLQTTAPVQPGNSGGPMLDGSGHVVGVVVARLNAIAVAKATGDIPQNINFAIRTPLVKSFLEINDIEFQSEDSVETMKVADISEKAMPGVVLVIAQP